LFDHAFPICLDYVKDPDSASDFQKLVFENVSRLFAFSWYYADLFSYFHHKFKEANGIQVLIRYMQSDEFIHQCLKHRAVFEIARGKRFIIKSLLHTFHCMTRNQSTSLMEWEQLGVSALLQRIYFNINDIRLRGIVSMSWSNVVSENEIENFQFPEEGYDRMTFDNLFLDKVVRAIVTKKDLYRVKIQMDESKVIEAAVLVADWVNQDFEFNIIDVLDGIYKVLVNDKAKLQLYRGLNLKARLKDIIIYGNTFEREYAAKCLWQLCFDETILKEVADDTELFQFMIDLDKKLNDDTQVEYRSLKKNVKGVLWMKDKLDKKNPVCKFGGKLLRSTLRKMNSFKEVVEAAAASQQGSSLATTGTADDKSNQAEQHVMISYNSASRDLCLRIKKDLERLGHSVWIDVEAISGSSLESMANAVENAKFVIICKF
jgi:hypothetical protein